MKKAYIFFILFFLFFNSLGQTNKTYRSIKEALIDSTSVKSLTLANISLSELPIEILKLKNLEEIALESNGNLDISRAIDLLSQLNHLKKLWISDNKISGMNGITRLKSLEELDLDNVEITELPVEISQLRNLREINLEDNPNLNIIQALKVLSKIDGLKTLWLSKNKLSNLPNEISGLKNLEDLWLDENEFTQIPESVKRLKIKYVSFFDNKIKQLNLKKGDLSNVTNINLCYNEFERFPVELAVLPNLKRITMWYCPIKYIPKEIMNFKKIEDINLEANDISTIPPQMAGLKTLHILSIGKNHLTTKGINTIYLIKSLEKLELNENKITTLSSEIGSLKKLENLDISGNPITDLPEAFSKLQKLKQLGLGGLHNLNWVHAFSLLEKLPNLKRIGMYDMNLEKMPVGFEKLNQVDTFWVNENLFDNDEKARLTKLLPNAKLKFN